LDVVIDRGRGSVGDRLCPRNGADVFGNYISRRRSEFLHQQDYVREQFRQFLSGRIPFGVEASALQAGEDEFGVVGAEVAGSGNRGSGHDRDSVCLNETGSGGSFVASSSLPGTGIVAP